MPKKRAGRCSRQQSVLRVPATAAAARIEATSKARNWTGNAIEKRASDAMAAVAGKKRPVEKLGGRKLRSAGRRSNKQTVPQLNSGGTVQEQLNQ